MNVRMHIIEESKIEVTEMPQLWKKCLQCQEKRGEHLTTGRCVPIVLENCCIECGSLNTDAIKEPRFMKNTNFLSPLNHFKQMCRDQKAICKRILNLNISRLGDHHSSDGDSQCDYKSINSGSMDFTGEYLSVEQKFIQEIREEAVIKILENGVRLCLKLQTSHIASMFFETWLEYNKKNDIKIRIENLNEEQWIN